LSERGPSPPFSLLALWCPRRPAPVKPSECSSRGAMGLFIVPARPRTMLYFRNDWRSAAGPTPRGGAG